MVYLSIYRDLYKIHMVKCLITFMIDSYCTCIMSREHMLCQWCFLQWRKCSMSVLPNTLASMWLLSTWNLTNASKELDFLFYLILIILNGNVATLYGSQIFITSVLWNFLRFTFNAASGRNFFPFFNFFIKTSLIFILIKVSHEKHCDYYSDPYHQVPPTHYCSHCLSV